MCCLNDGLIDDVLSKARSISEGNMYQLATNAFASRRMSCENRLG
jgi:hypothetical protein